MEFGMDVMPLEVTSDSYFWIFYNRYYQRDGCCNFWGGTTIHYYDVIAHRATIYQ
jgi:hypothetical protein